MATTTPRKVEPENCRLIDVATTPQVIAGL
jgi:hypothetical protein